MKIEIQKTPFEYIVIDDMYTKDELTLIWNEIDFLTPKLNTAEVLGTSATDEDGRYKKQAHGLILDNIYPHRSISDILQLNRKLFSVDVVEKAIECHPFFAFMKICNYDSTLLNCYRDGDYYDSHRDSAVLSAVTFFVTEGVTGGDFHFTDYDNYTVEAKNNRTIIFPSVISHSVDVVNVEKEGQARYSMAQFLFMTCKQ